MMQKMLTVTMICLLGFLGTTAQAEEPKIGYVDMARALNEVEDGRGAKVRLKNEFDQKQHRLDKMQNDLQTKKDEFDKRASTMKSDVKQSKQEELQREFMELQKTYMQLRQELADSEKTLIDDISKKIKGIIGKIGDKDGYLVILNIGDTVLYNKRHMDLTDKIIVEYNQQYTKKP